MDIIAITPTQQLLWVLLAFLLAWMIIFAWLAMRRTPEAEVEREGGAYYQSSPMRVTPLRIEPAKQAQVVMAKHENTPEMYLELSVR